MKSLHVHFFLSVSNIVILTRADVQQERNTLYNVIIKWSISVSDDLNARRRQQRWRLVQFVNSHVLGF